MVRRLKYCRNDDLSYCICLLNYRELRESRVIYEKRIDKSIACTFLVNAPEEIKSTPAWV